jgi:glycosyltransferase involved in cell wall biosynthesis
MPAAADRHLRVDGKFFRRDGELFLINGVTYGSGTLDPQAEAFETRDHLARDLDTMVRAGVNTIRTCTPPTLALLDEAARRGLFVMATMPWPQPVAFLDDRAIGRAIRQELSTQVRTLGRHPALLLFAVGNELPNSVVRWHGRTRVEQFLRELYDEAKSAVPESLFTYVNHPATEYLALSCFDVCAFNVSLHDEEELRAYVARLQHVAGSKPLLLAEAGADTIREGEGGRAAWLARRLRTAYAEGACGAVALTWTDQLRPSGHPVEHGALGRVDTQRRSASALSAVAHAFAAAPFGGDEQRTWPKVSVVVCAYNAAQTLEDCLSSLARLTYPDFEVLVVDDGSRDRTAEIARRHAFVRLLQIAQAGLSVARNVGLAHARGEIVAYTDADVRVDPEWLTHLVQPFLTSDVVAAGGPNVVPADDPWMAQCIARAPGGPTHVLLDDRIAEHVPGCNMAFRREALLAIGGFNPIFVRAGDDVDVCWRLQARGWNIGFRPAALVWHHHRASIRAYCRQQIGYGEGESWLMQVHPEKFVRGRVAWRGHIYSPLPFIRLMSSDRIHAGPFGSAAFPSIYRTDAHPFAYMPHSGRWQIAWTLLLGAGAVAAYVGSPRAVALSAAALMAMIATLVRCGHCGWRSDLTSLPPIGRLSLGVSRALYRLTISGLHFLQPFARLYGRVRGVISRSGEARRVDAAPPCASARRVDPGRPRASISELPVHVADGLLLLLGRQVETSFWNERWLDAETFLHAVADRLRRQRAVRQIELDSGWWEDRDLTVVDREWLRFDVRALVEDHGGGRCVCRVGIRSRFTSTAIFTVLTSLGVVAFLNGVSALASPIGAAFAALVVGIALWHVTAGSMVIRRAAAAVAAEFGMVAIRRKRNDRKHPSPVDSPVQPGVALPAHEWPSAGAREFVTVEPLAGRVAASSTRNARRPRVSSREL